MEQAWADDDRTVAGDKFHKNVDDPFFHEKRGNVITARSVPVSSSELGLSGICDVVEFVRDDRGVNLNPDKNDGLCVIRPIEYKVGHKKNGDWDKVQLCAETMALEESFKTHIESASFYYGSEKRRSEIRIDEGLRSLTRSLALEMHDLFSKGITPRAVPTESCKRCSLIDKCMPNLCSVSSTKAYLDEARDT